MTESVPAKIISVVRSGPETGQLIIERNFKHAEYGVTTEYSYDNEKSVERYVFFLTREELYALARDALKAASETVKITHPTGRY